MADDSDASSTISTHEGAYVVNRSDGEEDPADLYDEVNHENKEGENNVVKIGVNKRESSIEVTTTDTVVHTTRLVNKDRPRSRSGSRSRSRSNSPENYYVNADRPRSRSRSSSRSRSPENVYSTIEPSSQNRASRSRSRSPSPPQLPERPRSRSNSPMANGRRSRSRSLSPDFNARPKSRSRSRSPPGIVRSRSPSPPAIVRARSRSSSRSRSRSRSKSPVAVPIPAPRRERPSEAVQPTVRRDSDASDKRDGLQAHPAFANAGQQPGLEVWRIENSEPVRIAGTAIGRFYTGDAYIVLQTKESKHANSFEYNLHYWIGTECLNQDDLASVARRTVELDSQILNDTAVQYREVQNHETRLFLSYFRNNIRYLIGGLRSDYKEDGKRLFQIKGRKNIRIAQVPCMCGSLNQGDTFVLEHGRHIYVWIGPGSTRKEKLSGLMFARLLKEQEKEKKAHIHIVEDWWNDRNFFKALGSQDKAIKAADEHDDEDIIRRLDQATLFYRLDDTSMWELGQRPLKQEMLETDGVYILDSGPTGIYVWVGRKSSLKLKHTLWSKVQDFLDTRGYPYYLPVVRLHQDRETEYFKQYFYSWYTEETHEENEREHKFRRMESYEKKPLDDATGEVKVYRVEGGKMISLRKRAYGIFFGGDCYIIIYKSQQQDRYIIYFLLGPKSTRDEREASVKHVMHLDDELDGKTIHVRVVPNKEPVHFMKLFRGRVIYFMGGRVSGFRSLTDYEDYDAKQTYMFQIKGDENGIRAIQVVPRPMSLNSNDVFIMDTERKHYIWIGKFANQEEIEFARNILKEISTTKGQPSVIEEGRENAILWNALGGEEPYSTNKRRLTGSIYITPRLFHCTMQSGKFTVEELINFTQDDLIESDIMILDTFDEIYVWVGRKALEYEIQRIYNTVQTYFKVDPSSRNPDNTLVIVVKQGYEPPQFTVIFSDWDKDRWSKLKRFRDFVKETLAENDAIDLSEAAVIKGITDFFSYEELRRRAPPPGVDVKRKEMFLRPDEFQAVFHMDKESFMSLPEWKQTSLKRQFSLF